MTRALRILLTALLAPMAAPAFALDLPAGPLPTLDGEIGKGEWDGATVLESPAGRAYLRSSGRLLCIALEMTRPYAGERIDLEIAETESEGQNWSSHSFHPAAFFPQGRASPIAPVIARRASFALRGRAGMEAPYACLFRSHIYRRAESWSAEILLSAEAIGTGASRTLGLRLEVGPPTAPGSTARFTRAVDSDTPPSKWTPLHVEWAAGAPLFETPEEDARRGFELDLFREWLDQTLERAPRRSMLGAALDGTKDNARIEELLGQLAGCIEADGDDFFAHHYRLLLLRRANRPEEARAAFGAILERFPHAHRLPPIVQERIALLAQASRFTEIDTPDVPREVRDAFREMIEGWKVEEAFRGAEAQEGVRGRIHLETTRGRITLLPLATQQPLAAEALLGLVAGGVLVDLSPTSVTGGLGAEFVLGKAPLVPAREEHRRLAWRGTVGFLVDAETREALPRLFFATGHAHMSRRLLVAARILEGQERLDAFDRNDRILSAALAGPEQER